MDTILDIFGDDAFSLESLTDAVSKIDHVPGQCGALTFAGNGVGVPTTKVVIEFRNRALTIIPTSPRGGPAPQERRDKASAVEVKIPKVKLEETIGAAAIQNVRAFGSGDLIGDATVVVNDQLAKMVARLDLTLQHMRRGASKGKVLDADDSVLLDLFDLFGVSEPTPVTFTPTGGTLRASVTDVKRTIERNAKTLLPPGAQVRALCSSSFFDQFTGHDDVKAAFGNWQAAQQNLAADVRAGFNFGDVIFEEYRGTDGVDGEESSDGELTGQVGVAGGTCRFFLSGVPNLYTEKFGPADFLDSINRPGLPRYARIVIDPEMNRWVKVHLQSNPMPICLRPETLIEGTF